MFKLTVKKSIESKNFSVEHGQTVLDILRANSFHMPAVCGGNGICGKCSIRLTSGYLEITNEDRAFFSERELASGMRLACAARPDSNVEIEIVSPGDTGFSVLSSYSKPNPDKSPVSDAQNTGIGIAIDIGTTTICFEVLDLKSGVVLSAHSRINSQRRYGADVISRISTSNNGGLAELRDCVRDDVRSGISLALENICLSPKHVSKINIAANTTMIHILLGMSCRTLGEAPFTTPLKGRLEYRFCDIFDDKLCDCPVTILPPISAFVGGDITAGILFCDAHENENYTLLADLGTNGEIALCRKNEILCTSAAAGPAFEGGNISCGTGGIPGAVSKVFYKNKRFACETIGGIAPLGICGSGLTDVIACFAEHGFIDETGLLSDDFFDSGVDICPGVTLNQKDIREFQLAKSAVRAGIEVLIKTAGISFADVKNLYIAGSFGYYINAESAAKAGLIPREAASALTPIGNSSLGGCTSSLLKNKSLEAAEKIALCAREINLADNALFADLFAEYMYF